LEKGPYDLVLQQFAFSVWLPKLRDTDEFGSYERGIAAG
jgi:hypothetical protein